MDRIQALQLATLLLGVGTLLFALSTLRAFRRHTALRRRLAALSAEARAVVEDGSPDITGAGSLTLADRVKRRMSRFYARRQTVYLPPGIRLWRALLTAVIAAGLCWWLGGPVVGEAGATTAAAVALLVTPRLVFAASRRKTLEALMNQLPDAISLVVRATRAGIPVSESLRMVGSELSEPIAPLFRRIVDETAMGIDLETVLARAAANVRLPEFRFFVVTLLLQRETGGNLTEPLENLADMIRQRRRVQMRTRALTSEARSSAAVLAALPFLAGGGMAMLNPDYAMRLIDEPSGQTMLAVAGGLLLVGVGSMQLLIRRTLS
ncbi:type II secretion system F family protein [Azospirillum sp. YIM DDC1]|uniref:Type II secretion system F family protein n=1 Tax=Azospirillum aestuarii TaxID=2802052 RepID=A0ABS1I161_9PROT|nr:type II secretion system F family protein [Azospirillum aestuarii]MBK3773183.1 type II secretion system [Azospirillum brasilense]MBK4720813.1 type II secretion system F family protein [Azospirillum aestuarii]TWA85330.1 tight adherence protein B [Azospirillum brasilense]